MFRPRISWANIMYTKSSRDLSPDTLFQIPGKYPLCRHTLVIISLHLGQTWTIMSTLTQCECVVLVGIYTKVMITLTILCIVCFGQDGILSVMSGLGNIASYQNLVLIIAEE